MTSSRSRFEKYVVRQESGCWHWTGARNSDGYGRFYLDGKNRRAHRVAYEGSVGPIPEGLVLDHLCRNRCCVSPSHLEPVTLAENLRRGDQSGKGWKRDVVRCPRGHDYTPENTRTRTVGNGRKFRVCKACEREHRVLAKESR